jgi:hypothetical protein
MDEALDSENVFGSASCWNPQPNAADADSAKEVNSDPRAMRDEDKILQISRCALLTGRPWNGLDLGVEIGAAMTTVLTGPCIVVPEEAVAFWAADSPPCYRKNDDKHPTGQAKNHDGLLDGNVHLAS